MNEIIQHVPNLVEYLELIPICIIGFIAGFVSHLDVFQTKQWGSLIKAVLVSSFLGTTTYTLLSATDLPYLACVGVSAAVAYFGIDGSLQFIEKLMALKNGNPNKKENNSNG